MCSVLWGYKPGSRIPGLDADSAFSFWRHLRFRQPILTAAAPFPISPAVWEAPASPHPCQYLLLSVCLTLAILVGVKLHLIVVLMCIFLMANDFEHLCVFIGHLLSSLEKVIFHLAHCKRSLFWALVSSPVCPCSMFRGAGLQGHAELPGQQGQQG